MPFHFFSTYCTKAQLNETVMRCNQINMMLLCCQSLRIDVKYPKEKAHPIEVISLVTVIVIYLYIPLILQRRENCLFYIELYTLFFQDFHIYFENILETS